MWGACVFVYMVWVCGQVKEKTARKVWTTAARSTQTFGQFKERVPPKYFGGEDEVRNPVAEIISRTDFAEVDESHDYSSSHVSCSTPRLFVPRTALKR